MTTKPFYKSKTVLFNALAVIVFVASSFGYTDFAPDPEVMALAAAVLNLVLRYVTSTPIALGKGGE